MSIISSTCQAVVLATPGHRCGNPATCAAEFAGKLSAFCDQCKKETIRLLPDHDGTVFYTLDHLISGGHTIGHIIEARPLQSIRQRVMLDLETVGTRAGCVIRAIGAVTFGINAVGAPSILREFYLRVDLASCERAGLYIDADTMLWWMRQSREAQAEFCNTQDNHALPVALDSFANWTLLSSNRSDGVFDGEIWGNGADFDLPILGEAYFRCGHSRVPWGNFTGRCYRTIKSQRPDIKIVRSGAHHTALADARAQALHLMAIEAAETPSSSVPR